MPNPEAKPSSADGTALVRVWESRSPPTSNVRKRGEPRRQRRGSPISGGSPAAQGPPDLLQPLPCRGVVVLLLVGQRPAAGALLRELGRAQRCRVAALDLVADEVEGRYAVDVVGGRYLRVRVRCGGSLLGPPGFGLDRLLRGRVRLGGRVLGRRGRGAHQIGLSVSGMVSAAWSRRHCARDARPPSRRRNTLVAPRRSARHGRR